MGWTQAGRSLRARATSGGVEINGTERSAETQSQAIPSGKRTGKVSLLTNFRNDADAGMRRTDRGDGPQVWFRLQ